MDGNSDIKKLSTLSSHPDRQMLSAFEPINLSKLITFSDICSHTITVKVRFILDQTTKAQGGNISANLLFLKPRMSG